MECDSYTLQKNIKFFWRHQPFYFLRGNRFCVFFNANAVACNGNNTLIEKQPFNESRQKNPFIFVANIRWVGFSENKNYVGDVRVLDGCWLSFGSTITFQPDKSFVQFINTQVGKDKHHNSKQLIRDATTPATTAANNCENQADSKNLELMTANQAMDKRIQKLEAKLEKSAGHRKVSEVT
ncbi:hypothetical protein H4S08_002682 [Coemansia sp. RSA 1365]|nr:hypothetical protein H4S08_002682 [Coemansia sp. RSA 1365]